MDPYAAAISSATASRGGTTGADLLGWSALALLGSATSRTAPWLFVASRSLAWLSEGPLAEARFVQATAAYDRAWPFGEEALGGVVIDGDALARGTNEAALQSMLAEASRVVGRQGDVLVVCGYRLVPRRLRAWREYGRQSAEGWRRAAAMLGLNARTTGFVRLDSDRVTDVSVRNDDRVPESRSKRVADRLVLRVASSGQCEADAVETMVAHASREYGLELRIDRIAVRKIGKTAIFLSCVDGRRYIMRIARSPIALARATRNFDTLKWLHASSLPNSLKGRAPAALVRGRHAGYAYFVETCLDGRPGPRPVSRRTGGDRWEMEAVGYISMLHAGTQRRVEMDDGVMTRLVGDPLARLSRACGSSDAERVLRRVVAACEAGLRGRIVPLVHTHGDFTESNCLFDAGGKLTAVVDWEVAEAQGLPLLDLLQLMPIPNERGSHLRWLRFDAWLDLWRAPERVVSDPVIGSYMRVLDIPLQTIPGLILVQWATHVADRVDARSEDKEWMRLRLWQPLESLGRILRD
jgi:hypothetical protein